MLHAVLPTLMLNVPAVARKTASEVERVLGPPSQTIGSSTNQSYPRLSYLSGRVEVTFVDGLSSRIILHTPSDLPFHRRALAKLGLPVRKPTFIERGRRMRWTNIAGIQDITFEANPGGGVRTVAIRTAPHA